MQTQQTTGSVSLLLPADCTWGQSLVSQCSTEPETAAQYCQRNTTIMGQGIIMTVLLSCSSSQLSQDNLNKFIHNSARKYNQSTFLQGNTINVSWNCLPMGGGLIYLKINRLKHNLPCVSLQNDTHFKYSSFVYKLQVSFLEVNMRHMLFIISLAHFPSVPLIHPRFTTSHIKCISLSL